MKIFNRMFSTTPSRGIQRNWTNNVKWKNCLDNVTGNARTNNNRAMSLGIKYSDHGRKHNQSSHTSLDKNLPPSATEAAEIFRPLTSWLPSHLAEIGLKNGLFFEASNSDCIILEWFLKQMANLFTLRTCYLCVEKYFRRKSQKTHPPAVINRLQVKQTTVRAGGEGKKRQMRHATSRAPTPRTQLLIQTGANFSVPPFAFCKSGFSKHLK